MHTCRTAAPQQRINYKRHPSEQLDTETKIPTFHFRREYNVSKPASVFFHTKMLTRSNATKVRRQQQHLQVLKFYAIIATTLVPRT